MLIACVRRGIGHPADTGYTLEQLADIVWADDHLAEREVALAKLSGGLK